MLRLADCRAELDVVCDQIGTPTYAGDLAQAISDIIRSKHWNPGIFHYANEGVASWYGPGFHGKATASGETYNQYAMTAAHKILPLGTKVRVTHLGNGKSIIVRVNDRGPFVDDRVIDLSRAAATRLELMGKGTGRVRIQSLGNVPQISSSGNIAGDFFIQLGAFGQKENAEKLKAILVKTGQQGRLFFGSNNMWNVQAGPVAETRPRPEMIEVFRTLYPSAFVIRGN